MKNFSEQELKNSRPNVSAKVTVAHCLKMLYADKEKLLSDPVVKNLSYEELLGALLQCKDMIDENET